MARDAPAPFLRAVPGAVELFVRLTPRGGADRFEGAETTADGRVHIRARVRAIPEKGAANAALESLVARHAGVPRGDVAIISGATGRLKTMRISGDVQAIADKLLLLA